ncbi:LOW QUALITY PROTEIN: hypothetical protein PFNF135_04397 [Plasmodium falciparum NF135/5.C10]|uniref:Uncharacterized protein n=1 Tax=Plasmodium falciparum NF135/5.C10 TaxID=1036726 RepID=W4IBV9_PLAFA|nr:LOW QUALITY PROTEIN: hypothetical protein PFNF135_04397 [Plasmodium falciparum NF135/5.C10]
MQPNILHLFKCCVYMFLRNIFLFCVFHIYGFCKVLCTLLFKYKIQINIINFIFFNYSKRILLNN